jgi:hypothetical protein
MMRAPLSAAAEEGAKTTVTVADFPGARSVGEVKELTLKTEPETVTALSATLFVPTLLILRDWEFFWPTTTALKSTTEGTTEI